MATPIFQHTEASTGTTGYKDFNLRAINIMASGMVTLDVKPMMVELSYYEDIFSNTTSGKLIINDIQGLIEQCHIHGNEYIRISFAKDSDDEDCFYIDKLFRIFSISDRQKLNNSQTEGYVINFCSDELLLSEQYRISKSYPGKTIKEIVIDILENDLKAPINKFDKKNIQDTSGTYSFIIPNLKPFHAIEWLSQYAKPADTTQIGSDMIFFENAKDGYVFSSMQALFSKESTYTFKYGAKNLQKSDYECLEDFFFNVISYTYHKNFDVLEGIHNGTFANRLLSLDILQHSYNVTDYDYEKNSQNATTLNNNPVVNNLQNRFGHALNQTPNGLLRVAMSNANQYDNPFIAARPGSVSQDISVETFLTQRKSQLAINSYTTIQAVLGGNPTLSVGQTVDFNIVAVTPDKQKPQDSFYAGKYLISAIRHTIQVGGYNTVCELIKDSNMSPYNNVDNDSPIWKNTVAGVKK